VERNKTKVERRCCIKVERRWRRRRLKGETEAGKFEISRLKQRNCRNATPPPSTRRREKYKNKKRKKV